jgi:methenyltetrahydrofolate cyclohydrolase
MFLMVFIDDLAHKSPVPGGGAASAHCAALAVALLFKIVKVLETKSPDETKPEYGNLLEKLTHLLDGLARLEKEDSEAYLALSRERKNGETGNVDQAVRDSINPPLHIMERALEALRTLHDRLSDPPRHLRADLLVCVELLAAAHNGAAAIARANIRLFKDPRIARHMEDHIAARAFEFGSLQKIAIESLCAG